jgi:hypothetical protein
MTLPPFLTFSKTNRRQILLLIASHLLWSAAILALGWSGSRLEAALPWWSGVFIALQLFAAAQLLLPALGFMAEDRSRGFYLFWGFLLALSIWLVNQWSSVGIWEPLLTAVKSGLLLLVATLIGAALARYVHRLWELAPICLVMSLADLFSWRFGPTATFTQDLQHYYLTGKGEPPLVDMVLVKLAFPGQVGLAPLFGISDWIMVVFFAIVNRRYGLNDNLIGAAGVTLAHRGGIGRYLPLSVVALYFATMLAQTTGFFVPALPLIAVIMLLWYAVRYLYRPG